MPYDGGDGRNEGLGRKLAFGRGLGVGGGDHLGRGGQRAVVTIVVTVFGVVLAGMAYNKSLIWHPYF